jgi:hypothetical protein
MLSKRGALGDIRLIRNTTCEISRLDNVAKRAPDAPFIDNEPHESLRSR